MVGIADTKAKELGYNYLLLKETFGAFPVLQEQILICCRKFWLFLVLAEKIQIKILRVRRGFAGPVGAGFFNFITALRKEIRIIVRRGKEDAQAFPKFLIASPSFHGGRGALPSAGGHPADLTFLAGGGH